MCRSCDNTKEPLTLIMNQYVPIGKGHSIHLSAQLEHHGNQVDDLSITNAGSQFIVIANGYVIPFAICDGLVYMNMCPQKIWNYMKVPTNFHNSS